MSSVGRHPFEKKCASADESSQSIANLRRCRARDLAATKGGGAFTCGTKIGVDSSGIYYAEDVKRDQWSAGGVRSELRSTAVEDGLSVRIHLPQDPGQAGKDQAEQLIRHLAGFNVKDEPVSGSKEARAFSFAAQRLCAI